MPAILPSTAERLTYDALIAGDAIGAHSAAHLGVGGSVSRDYGRDEHVSLAVDVQLSLVPLMDVVERVIRYLSLTALPTVPEASEAYLANTIDRSTYETYLQLEGIDPDTWEPIIQARRDRLTPQEIIQWGRRNDIADTVIADALRDNGWLNKPERDARLELYDELPTIADHLHWLTRNADDRQYVKDYGLLDGFASIEVIHGIKGLEDYQVKVDPRGRNFWSQYGHDLRARGMKVEYAANHYAAHWLLPSPSQLREFLYRESDIRAAGLQPFTLTDLDRLLAEQDYSPLSRRWFVATAYAVPAISYIKEWYRQDIIKDYELKEYHQKLGYNPKDSDNFVAIDDLQKRRMRASASHGWTTAAASAAWAAEQITSVEHSQIFARLGYNETEAQESRKRANLDLKRSIFTRARARALTSTIGEVKKALRVGVIDTDRAASILQDAGWPKQYASGLAQSESVAASVDRINQVVGAVRKAYLRGEITSEGVSNLLARAGIIPASIDAYMSVWALQRTQRQRSRTAAQVLQDLIQGHITDFEATARWRNLGYDDGDVRLYLADAQGKLAKLEAARLAVQQRQDKGAQAAVAKALRAAKALQTRLRQKLQRVAPPAKLQKWASLGLIGHDLFLSRMRLLGYPDEAIARYWEEACAKKTAKCKSVVPGDETGLGSGEKLP